MNEKRMMPSTKFTRDELQALAIAGVRERVRDIERQLQRMQREFPSVFITDAPLVLLAPEARTDGKAWPLLPPPKRRVWTPAPRKAVRKKTPKKKTGVPVWQRMQAVSVAAPDQRATSKELQQAVGASDAAVAGSATQHDDIFKRIATGVYTLTPAGRKAAENGVKA